MRKIFITFLSLPLLASGNTGFYGGVGVGLDATKGNSSINRQQYFKGTIQRQSLLTVPINHFDLKPHAVWGYHWKDSRTYKAVDVTYQMGGSTHPQVCDGGNHPVSKLTIQKPHSLGVTGRYGMAMDGGVILYGSLGIWASVTCMTFSVQGQPAGRARSLQFGMAPGFGIMKKMGTVSLRVDYAYLTHFGNAVLNARSGSTHYKVTLDHASHMILLTLMFDL